MLKSFKNSVKKAFTITELAIVIAVIAILAAVLIPTFSNVISNANKSSAMQTCNNAMKNYSALLAEAGESTDSMDGMAFTYNSYVYVYINSSLQYVGMIEDLDTMTVSYSSDNDQYTVSLNDDADLDDDVFTTVDTGTVDATYYDTSSNPYDTSLTISYYRGETLYSSVDIALSEFMSTSEKSEEKLYFYSIEDNGMVYHGFFTLETSAKAYVSESAQYSHYQGYGWTDDGDTGTFTFEITDEYVTTGSGD